MYNNGHAFSPESSVLSWEAQEYILLCVTSFSICHNLAHQRYAKLNSCDLINIKSVQFSTYLLCLKYTQYQLVLTWL